MYIFSRDSSTNSYESKEEDKGGKRADDIKMHVFSFEIRHYNYEFYMKHLEKMEEIIEEKYKKTIEADLLAKFRNKITDDYKDFKINATKEQKLFAINNIKGWCEINCTVNKK